MYETREVTITLRLPPDIADQAEDIQKEDPEFLSRVVLYGLTRVMIYRSIRERSEEDILKSLRVREEYSEQRREELERIQRRSGLPVQRRPVR